jgi:hypothetical protein
MTEERVRLSTAPPLAAFVLGMTTTAVIVVVVGVLLWCRRPAPSGVCSVGVPVVVHETILVSLRARVARLQQASTEAFNLEMVAYDHKQSLADKVALGLATESELRDAAARYDRLHLALTAGEILASMSKQP